MDADRLVALGRVTGIHGIRGAVKMRFYSGDAPAALAPGAAVRLRLPDGQVTVLTATEIAVQGRHLRLRLAQIENRDGAQALVGAEMVVARGELPEPEADAYYWADLIGLTVYGQDGACLGRLVEILQTGANDVYRVQGEQREVLVPALSSVVRRVDLAAGQMWVELPEGL